MSENKKTRTHVEPNCTRCRYCSIHIFDNSKTTYIECTIKLPYWAMDVIENLDHKHLTIYEHRFSKSGLNAFDCQAFEEEKDPEK